MRPSTTSRARVWSRVLVPRFFFYLDVSFSLSLLLLSSGKDFISDYLIALDGCQVADEKQKNIFTLAVLSILSRLVAFGFYGSRAEVGVCFVVLERARSSDGAARKDDPISRRHTQLSATAPLVPPR